MDDRVDLEKEMKMVIFWFVVRTGIAVGERARGKSDKEEEKKKSVNSFSDSGRKASVEEPMDLEKIELVVAEGEAGLKSEGDGEEDDITILGGKKPNDPLLEELDNLFPLSPLRCIYRVPERLRQGNEKAYTPQVVSIGPLHHGNERFKVMEEHKKRYLRHFLSRTSERVSFSDYIQMIKDQEGRLRGSYAESIEFGSDQFVRIVLVDAAFVIEFLLRSYFLDYGQDEDDYIFNMPHMFWDVRPDLWLLENQLPFFILQDLFNTLFPSSHQLPSLLEISYNCFKSEIDSKGKEEKFEQIRSLGDVQHFVSLLRILYLPLVPLEAKPRVKFTTTAVPNVAELVQSGVKFMVGRGSNLFDIKFSSGSGILEIPKLEVNETTNMTLRNLLAFEQCNTREVDYPKGCAIAC